MTVSEVICCFNSLMICKTSNDSAGDQWYQHTLLLASLQYKQKSKWSSKYVSDCSQKFMVHIRAILIYYIYIYFISYIRQESVLCPCCSELFPNGEGGKRAEGSVGMVNHLVMVNGQTVLKHFIISCQPSMSQSIRMHNISQSLWSNQRKLRLVC